jgi:hypothetical protein
MSDEIISMGQIDPESPKRLRALIKALSSFTGAHVLRVELELGASTRSDVAALTMTITHTLGPEHENEIGPHLARAFSATLSALAKNASKDPDAEQADVYALAYGQELGMSVLPLTGRPWRDTTSAQPGEKP